MTLAIFLDIHLKLQFFAFTLVLTLLTGCSTFSTPRPTDDRTTELAIHYDSTADTSAIGQANDRSSIKVVSLNMAHGRGDSFTQFFVSELEIRENLADIVEFLKREDADIVTLQEADAPSQWSGNFNHVEFLAREAGYDWYTQANHVSNWFGTYGTAVMSRFPIVGGYGIDFKPTPPTTRKGFTLAEIEWRAEDDSGQKTIIDVVSVHLDFSRHSKRIEQVEDMKEVLGKRTNPTIVTGDFNSEWVEGEQVLQALAARRGLKTHRPEAHKLFTYLDDRFDWILISEEFEFCNYHAATDILSDHLAVISEVIAKNEAPLPEECTAG
jgi:endonuclease/exonuclease/phosphatase family metal-dependent hydrolase